VRRKTLDRHNANPKLNSKPNLGIYSKMNRLASLDEVIPSKCQIMISG